MRTPVRTLSLLLTALVASAIPTVVRAQTTSATLSGIVRTEDGTPVGDAIVQARSDGTGTLRTVITDAKGRYRLELLDPGRWIVAARLGDGLVSESRSIEVGLQQSVTVDFTVGAGVTERMTVTAEAPLVDRREAGDLLRITDAQINNLPLSGRVFTDLAKLDSSVQTAAPGNFYGERGAVFLVNGQSGRSNSFLVDGLDNNDQTSGTTINSFYSQLVIQEFVLLKHQFSAEFGRASGGVLNVLTRQGTNEPQWEGFLQGSLDSWNTSGEFVDALPQTEGSATSMNRFQGGVRLGGPLKKDKSFYFVAYERHETDDVLPYTGIDRDGVAGGLFVAPSTDNSLFLRTDFNLGPANTLMVRFNADDRTSSGVNVSGLMTPEAGFLIEERDLALAGTLKTVFSPRLFNEARLMIADSAFDQFANSDRPGVTRPSGIFGGNNLNQQIRDERRFQLVDNVTWRLGQHTTKFGIDVVRSNTRIRTKFNPSGNLIYNSDQPFETCDFGNISPTDVGAARSGDTLPLVSCFRDTLLGLLAGFPNYGVDDDGDGLIDEPGNLNSYPVVYTIIDGQPQVRIEDTRLALFAQDQWQAGKKWFIDYGVRYDVSTYTLPEETRVESSIPNGGAGRDTDNVAPRLGITFTPTSSGKLVLRGGAGVFYDKLVLGFPAVAAITSGTTVNLTFPQGLTDEETNEAFIEANGVDAVRDRVLEDEDLQKLAMHFSTGPELQTPYTVQYNLGLEQAVGQNSAARLDFTRSRGYHLPMMVDLNPVICVPDPADFAKCGGDFPVHVDTEVGSIAAVVTEGSSWYTGVDLSWRWRRKGSWFSASYTWSKAEDMGFDPLKGGIALPPDSQNLAAERGRADGDRRHRFVVSGEMGLPGTGFRASGALQLASGMAFNVTTGEDDNLDGILSDRPEGVGRNTGKSTPLDIVNELRAAENEILLKTDPDAELLQPIGALNEPAFFQVDVRLFYPFDFNSERNYGEVYLQVFNLFDRVNVGLIEGSVISRNFGRVITLAGPPRTIELGFKLGY